MTRIDLRVVQGSSKPVILPQTLPVEQDRMCWGPPDPNQLVPTGDWNQMLIDQFSKYQAGRGFSPRTVDRRMGTLRAFARHLAPKTIDHATTVDVEDFLGGFAAPRTRHAYRSDLRVFYKWAIARDLLAVDPTALIDPVKIPKSLPRPLGLEVHAALLTASKRVRKMIGLGLYAGLRISEIASLDATDVVLHHDPPLLTVRNGKGGKDRVIPMHPALVELLSDIPRHGPVFTNRQGGAVRANSVYHSIKRQFQRCGIDATPHQLRHTFGTEAARAAKGNLVVVATLMGHESMQTTKGYVGWSGEQMELISQMFDPKRRAA